MGVDEWFEGILGESLLESARMDGRGLFGALEAAVRFLALEDEIGTPLFDAVMGRIVYEAALAHLDFSSVDGDTMGVRPPKYSGHWGIQHLRPEFKGKPSVLTPVEDSQDSPQ